MHFKQLNIGFIIISCDNNVKLIRNTYNSIRKSCKDCPIIICVSDEVHEEDEKELGKITKVYKGQKTVSSLLNIGMKNVPDEWNYIIIAGSIMRPYIERKYSYFAESEKDILFPIANRIYNFVDGTINGLFLHKNVYKDVGDFSNNPLEICKLFWAEKAIEKGYKFKAIQGSKIC